MCTFPARNYTEAGRAARSVPSTSAPSLAMTLRRFTAFIERRYTLDERIRADLAGRMATALRPRVGGGIDDLSDEQLRRLSRTRSHATM